MDRLGATLEGMNMLRLITATVTCFLALSAYAQWQWIDKDGHRVFSDLPPPPSVPDKNILKRPRGGSTAAPASAAPTLAPAAAGEAPPTAPAGADKSLEEKKKKAEAAEEAKRKEQEQRNAQQRADTCIRAQQAKASLDAGGRLSHTNARGEREFMDESAIAAEQQRVQGIINESCR